MTRLQPARGACDCLLSLAWFRSLVWCGIYVCNCQYQGNKFMNLNSFHVLELEQDHDIAQLKEVSLVDMHD